MDTFRASIDPHSAAADAVRAYLKASSAVTPELEVDALSGEYARVRVSAPGLTPATAFVRRQGNTWQVLFLGTGFTAADFDQHAIPADLRV